MLPKKEHQATKTNQVSNQLMKGQEQRKAMLLNTHAFNLFSKIKEEHELALKRKKLEINIQKRVGGDRIDNDMAPPQLSEDNESKKGAKTVVKGQRRVSKSSRDKQVKNDLLHSKDKAFIMERKTSHLRINSDYMNDDQLISSPIESPLSEEGDETVRQRRKLDRERQAFLRKALNAEVMCQKEQFEGALREYQTIVENLASVLNSHPAYKAFMFYNMGCCYHRLQQIPDCIEALKESIVAFELHIHSKGGVSISQLLSKEDGSTETKDDSINGIQEIGGSSQSGNMKAVDQLFLLRAQCKIGLQLCAIMSQANKHEEALDLARKCNVWVMQIIDLTHKVCTEYIDLVSSQRQESMAKDNGDNRSKSRQRKQSTSKNIEGEEEGDYTPATATGILRKNRSGCLILPSNDQINGRRGSANDMMHQGDSKKAIESSFISQATSNNNTRLKFDERRHSKSGGGRKKAIDDSSLERIHTFHLKKSPLKEDNADEMTVKVIPVEVPSASFQILGGIPPREGLEPKTAIFRTADESKQSSHLSNKGTQSMLNSFGGAAFQDKAYYIQEKTVVHQDTVLRTFFPVICELKRIIKKESAQSLESGYKLLKSCFTDDKEIDQIKCHTKFKLCIRSVLGLPKNSLSGLSQKGGKSQEPKHHQEDTWIYHLNIGNVMHLSILTLEDFNRLESIPFKQSSEQINTTALSPAGGARLLLEISPDRMISSNDKNQQLLVVEQQTDDRQYMTAPRKSGQEKEENKEERLQKLRGALNKNEMLDKIVLLVVSLFCMGTELRFKSQQEQGNSEASSQTRIFAQQWHAHAIHVASVFLPDECPLVGHMINSYKKHHMRHHLQRNSSSKKKVTENSTATTKHEESSSALKAIEGVTPFAFIDAKKTQLSSALFDPMAKNIGTGGMFADRRQSDSNLLQQAEKVHQSMQQVVLTSTNYALNSKQQQTRNSKNGFLSSGFKTSITPVQTNKAGTFQLHTKRDHVMTARSPLNYAIEFKQQILKQQNTRSPISSGKLASIPGTTKQRSPRNPAGTYSVLKPVNPPPEPMKLLHGSPSGGGCGGFRKINQLKQVTNKKSTPPIVAVMDQSHISDLVVCGEDNLLLGNVNEFENQFKGRMAVKREFGGLKKPKDTAPISTLSNKQPHFNISSALLQTRNNKCGGLLQTTLSENIDESNSHMSHQTLTVNHMSNHHNQLQTSQECDTVLHSPAAAGHQLNKYRSQGNLKLDELLKQFEMIKKRTTELAPNQHSSHQEEVKELCSD